MLLDYLVTWKKRNELGCLFQAFILLNERITKISSLKIMINYAFLSKTLQIGPTVNYTRLEKHHWNSIQDYKYIYYIFIKCVFI